MFLVSHIFCLVAWQRELMQKHPEIEKLLSLWYFAVASVPVIAAENGVRHRDFTAIAFIIELMLLFISAAGRHSEFHRSSHI